VGVWGKALKESWGHAFKSVEGEYNKVVIGMREGVVVGAAAEGVSFVRFTRFVSEFIVVLE
jgi:hypothetical protein